MIPLPPTIKVGGIQYDLVLEKGTDFCGALDPDDCLIRIDDEQAPQHMTVAIWHEVLHAILHAAGQQEQDEQAISALAYGIIQVLRDNPILRLAPLDP